MGEDILVRTEGVSKKFSLSLGNSIKYGIKDIGRDLIGIDSQPQKLREGEFWAVDNVSFELRRGESLGIMGHNGSGKTTLLKLLSGIFMPDKGRVEINGRVGVLIMIGAGFHPLLSGRENIYVNGAILGMSKKEIEKKMDSMIDFAEIGDFIDSPVKFYSSGMYVRLGFSIAIHSEPDILLVDDILAVGDRNFQIKCFRKMHELKKKKELSIMLVAHNEYAIREFTQRCLVLNKGKMVFSGVSEDAISFYINSGIKKNERLRHLEGSIVHQGIIKDVIFKDLQGKVINKIKSGESICIEFHYETRQTIKNPIFGIDFFGLDGLTCGFWNSYDNVIFPDISGKGVVRISVDKFFLPVDHYYCHIVLCEQEESNVIEWKNLQEGFVVERPNNMRGFIKLDQKWEMFQQ